MPLIKSGADKNTRQIRARIDEKILGEIEEYVKVFDLRSTSLFLEEAAKYLLRKDKDWKKYKEQATR